MSNDIEDLVPFPLGSWVRDINNPGQPGQYTGEYSKAGPHIMVQLSYPDGSVVSRPLAYLELMEKATETLEDKLRKGRFGKLRDLQRLITFEKLKGVLHEVIYSMEAAQIDFYPYQFKPVLKFINSPTERLIIADEVGLGKTIESALIWLELQARRQAKRMLVVCPKILAEKWRYELRSKFLIDAHVADFQYFQREISDLLSEGESHPFALIATYTGIRPPKSELRLVDNPPEQTSKCSPKTDLLRKLRHWQLDFYPFDLVIFDEAHYMRNPATTTFHLGKSLAENAGAVLCVSATPVNNSNTDLHSLLRLTDEDFFGPQGTFETLLAANRPTVQAANALSQNPPDLTLLQTAIEGMSSNLFIRKSPLFRQFLEKVKDLDFSNKSNLAKCQDLTEKLNLLGGYVNRTRRVQVKENRPLRRPKIIPVRYSNEEMQLYQAILKLVRAKCRKDNRPFHVFQVLGLQLRAASCLPALAQEIRDGRFGSSDDLFSEAFWDRVDEEVEEDSFFEEYIDPFDFQQLLNYDFETNDSKYIELLNMLEKTPDNKIIVFAYYRKTLAYLKKRLMQDGISVTVIHGGIPNERRWEEIERFKDPNGPKILLSSEVGSEGIDLQFCRMMINYDLPWNPMRVEQRIGRIDRVGQQAKRLLIFNFKIHGTVEERIYDKLHQKLEKFANSLGDLEAVIGNEIQELTIEILSKNLSPEEESRLIEQSERVIEENLIQVAALEESGDSLIAFSDYLQRKIEDDQKKGRYLQANELEDYLTDFFEREFQGCAVFHNTPLEGCIRISLNNEARQSLSNFIRDDRSISAQPLRKKEFDITFRREIRQNLSLAQQKSIHFVNHLSPLIRWITKINRDQAHNIYNVSAVQLDHPSLSPGDYCYRIERWQFKGISKQEVLAYGIGSLGDGNITEDNEAESIVQNLLRNGKDWNYEDCDKNALIQTHRNLENDLRKRFENAVLDFEAENENSYLIKTQRVNNLFDRRIAQDRQRLRTLRERNRGSGVIRAAEGLLKKGIENKNSRLQALESKAKTDIDRAQVGAGVFRVRNGTSA